MYGNKAGMEETRIQLPYIYRLIYILEQKLLGKNSLYFGMETGIKSRETRCATD